MTTVADLDGLFKRVYGKGPVDLIPKAAYIQGRKALEEPQKIGKQFEFPVVVRNEQGATYAAPSSGAFALNGASSMIMQNAEVDGSQLLLRGTLDYESAAKAVSAGTKAFASATKTQLKSLMESTRHRLEVANLYGRSDSGIGVATSTSNVNTTTTVVTLTDASWAGGIWASHEGAQVQFRELGNLTNLVSAGADSVFTVVAVDDANKAIRVTGTTTGITALDADIAAGGGTDYAIFFNGAFNTEHVGLDKMITNTGTLFGIDAATYTLWRGNTFDAGTSAITFELVSEAINASVSRGLDTSVDVLVSPSTWTKILTDQSALRRYNEARGDFVNGAEGLTFHSQNGTINFIPHIFVKDGDVFILPMDVLHRIGAQDVSFEIPGAPGQIFRHLDDAAGYEFRTYSNQALIISKPSVTTKMTNFS